MADAPPLSTPEKASEQDSEAATRNDLYTPVHHPERPLTKVADRTRAVPAAARKAQSDIDACSPSSATMKDESPADADDAAPRDDKSHNDSSRGEAPEEPADAAAAREEPESLEGAAAPPATAQKRPAAAEPRAADSKKARRTDGRTDGPKGDGAPDQKSAPPKPAKKSKKKKAEPATTATASLAADFFSGKVRDAEPPKKKPRTRKKK